MTTPPTEPNALAPAGAKAPPRALLLGGIVLGLAGVAAAGFYFIPKLNKTAPTDEASTAPPVVQQMSRRPRPGGAPNVGRLPAAGAPAGATPAAKSPLNAAKQQAADAAKAIGAAPTARSNENLDTSFDNVPKSLGGDEKRQFPAAPAPPKDNGGKVLPIVEGRLPSSVRSDPFVSRLIVAASREYAYGFALPIRLAALPKPPPPPKVTRLPPELAYGPLRYPGRLSGIVNFGGISALLENSYGGGGDVIIQPGQQIPSGIIGLGQLTVESINDSGATLRDTYGRTTRVLLSANPNGTPSFTPPPGSIPGGGPRNGQGGPPSGFPGAPSGGGGATQAD